jgi:hypothetical protein
VLDSPLHPTASSNQQQLVLLHTFLYDAPVQIEVITNIWRCSSSGVVFCTLPRTQLCSNCRYALITRHHGAMNRRAATCNEYILPPSQNKCNSRIQNLSYKECNFSYKTRGILVILHFALVSALGPRIAFILGQRK